VGAFFLSPARARTLTFLFVLRFVVFAQLLAGAKDLIAVCATMLAASLMLI
jgi:hypothetical protein